MSYKCLISKILLLWVVVTNSLYAQVSSDGVSYTLDPGSVEMVVEMDPANYGFRTRSHRMSFTGDFDFILRGRAGLRYDYRFFEYFSLGIVTGMTWSKLSIFSQFKEQMDKPTPKTFSIYTGVAGKMRLTEWYMRSSIFVEASALLGYSYQTINNKNANHASLTPGAFVGMERVFDSGLIAASRIGVEWPLNFGDQGPVKDGIEPLLLFSIGLAI